MSSLLRSFTLVRSLRVSTSGLAGVNGVYDFVDLPVSADLTSAIFHAEWVAVVGVLTEGPPNNELEVGSAILYVSKTMMHEIVHQAVGWDIFDVDSFHCDLSCCPDRAAPRFWACKASSYGCVSMSSGTADGLTTTGAYGRPSGVAQFSTLCDDATGAGVTTTIKLDDPGEPSQPNDWSIASETLPANCP